MEGNTKTCNGTCEVCTCKSDKQSCHTALAKVSPPLLPAFLYTSIGMLITCEHQPDRFQDDLNIQQKTPVFNVPDILLHSFFHLVS